MDKPRGNKWLLIISLVVGLSFGVHFMALLTILQYFTFSKLQVVTLKILLLLIS
jgi:hypothetical protein